MLQLLALERFHEGDDIVDLIGVEPELRHGRMVGDDPFGQRPSEILDGILAMQIAKRRGDLERTFADRVERMTLTAMRASKRQSPLHGGRRLRSRRRGRHERYERGGSPADLELEVVRDIQAPFAGFARSAARASSVIVFGQYSRQCSGPAASDGCWQGHARKPCLRRTSSRHAAYPGAPAARSAGYRRNAAPSSARRRFIRSAASGHLPASARSCGTETPTSCAMRPVSSAPQQSERRKIRPRGAPIAPPPRSGIEEIRHRCLQQAKAQPFSRPSAARLRSTMRREVGSSIAAAFSSCVSVRETVSMVRPR